MAAVESGVPSPGDEQHGVQRSEDAREKYRSYPGRYYVLTVTALLAATQNVAWLTFGPITTQAQTMYGLTDWELTLLPRK